LKIMVSISKKKVYMHFAMSQNSAWNHCGSPWSSLQLRVACCRILYTVLGDEVTYNNKTLYKWNSQNLGSSPEAVFKLPSPVVLLPKKENSVVVVLELHIVS
jgi:hypothetical protein